MAGQEKELKKGLGDQAAMAKEFVGLKDVAMDFTLEDWEKLDPRDLFWDTALDNYEDLFLLSPMKPSHISQPDGKEELDTLGKGSLEAMGPDVIETPNSPSQQGFLEEGLFQEIMDAFSEENSPGLNLETCTGESWLDSFLEDADSLFKSDFDNEESPKEDKLHEFESDLGPEPLPISSGEAAVMCDIPEESLTLVKDFRSDSGFSLEQNQQDSVQVEEKQFKCSECEESFSYSFQLIQHWNSHTREKPPVQEEQKSGPNKSTFLLVCPEIQICIKSCVFKECGKALSENTSLQWHQEIYTGENVRENEGSDQKETSKSQSAEGKTPLKSQGTDSTKLRKPKSAPTSQNGNLKRLRKSWDGDDPLILRPGRQKAKSYKCRKCGETFSRAFHLAGHRKVHTQKLYKCAKCPEIFSLRKHFLQHQKVHFAKPSYECQECGKTFRQKSSLIKHQACHTGEKPYKCDECGKAFIHATTLKIHQRVHSGDKPYRCSECGKAFCRRSHLSEHQQVHTGRRPHQCPECARSFSRPSHLIRHQLSHATEKLFGCAKCQETFSHKEHLAQHEKIHSIKAPYKCQECGEQFVCHSTLNCHLSTHTREKQGCDDAGGKVKGENPRLSEKCFKCDRCGKAFRCIRYLTKHEKIHAKVTPFECNQCGQAFGQSLQLIRHQRIHFGVRPDECSEPRKAGPVMPSLSEHPLQCNRCTRIFSQSTHLLEHQLTHTGEQPFKCSECDRVFKQNSSLLRHQRTHTKKHLECGECGRTFSQSSCFNKHRKIHAGKKLYECSDCGKAFNLRALLIRHQRVHTGEKPYICQECGKAFSQNSCLSIHQRVHTGEKPFACSTCGKAFTQKANLMKHERVHTGEKPYACDVCGRAFALNTHLTQHQRTHTQEKPYSCKYCPKTFRNCSSLSQHYRSRSRGKLQHCPQPLGDSRVLHSQTYGSEVKTNTSQTLSPSQ